MQLCSVTPRTIKVELNLNFALKVSFNCDAVKLRKYITSMWQEAEATGNWRVNNSPTIQRVAKRQQTKQKSKCQLAAQGYNNANLENAITG
jgi:hypothetical protein